MKKYFLIVCFLYFQNIFLAGQNLIPNPGFDSIARCPEFFFIDSNPSRIYEAIPPWFSPIKNKLYISTPDVFAECSKTLSVPYHRNGAYQLARSGTAYAGLISYTKHALREYIETPLKIPMEKNRTYFVRFYVSPLNEIRSLGHRMTYSDAIGIKFTDTLYHGEDNLITEASVENLKGLIKDTVGWTPICGLYKAKGGEKYATIGNFRTDDKTMIEYEDPQYSPSFRRGPYFYIEDVSVQLYDPLPDSLLLCKGEIKQFNAAFSNAQYRWSTGTSDSILTISKDGKYTVTVTLDGCEVTDSLYAYHIKETEALPPDTALCEGQKIVLQPTITGKTYRWSTGEQTPIIEVSTSGNYTVSITNECGIFNSTSNIIFNKCDCAIFIPTAFSPNSDGTNDVFKVEFGCDIPFKVKRFQIFNRWGNLMYSLKGTNEASWDGTSHNGYHAPAGVYIWQLEYEVEKNGKMQTLIKSGDITILK